VRKSRGSFPPRPISLTVIAVPGCTVPLSSEQTVQQRVLCEKADDLAWCSGLGLRYEAAMWTDTLKLEEVVGTLRAAERLETVSWAAGLLRQSLSSTVCASG
jgi:hypothetical protein